MSKYFDEGEPIFYMDDDISEMYQNYNHPELRNRNTITHIDSNYNRSNNYLLPLTNLHKFILNGFQGKPKKEIAIIGVFIQLKIHIL